MLRLYKYLYYRIYSRNLRLRRDEPEWIAVLYVSFMMFVNVNFVGLLTNLVGINLYTRETSEVKYIIILIAVAFAGLNYFIFIHSGKYKTIVKEFENEDAKNRKANTTLLWLYFILSFSLPVMLIVFTR